MVLPLVYQKIGPVISIAFTFDQTPQSMFLDTCLVNSMLYSNLILINFMESRDIYKVNHQSYDRAKIRMIGKFFFARSS